MTSDFVSWLDDGSPVMIRRCFLLLFLLPQATLARNPDLPGLLYAGEITLGCKSVKNERGPVPMPSGFKIGPDDAMRLAVEKAKLRCNSIFEFVIYADSSNYYIFYSIGLDDERVRKLVTPQLLAAHEIVVNGRTGAVVDNRGK